MTETLAGPPPAGPPPPDGRRLVRDPDDKVVAGVCAAFGRYTDTDPVLWRVTVAVLTLFGGTGLALYALGWLLLPERGRPQSVAERTLQRPDRGLSVAGVVLLVLGGLLLIGLLDNGPGLSALLVLGGIAYLVSRERRENPVVASPTEPPLSPTPYGPPPPWMAGPADLSAPPQPPLPRERSPLGGLTVSLAALVAGLLLTLRLIGVDELTVPRILAAALLVLGAGLLVGTWFGRARWLIPVGLVLALAVGATAAAQGFDVDDGVGQRTWVADGGSEQFALGAGEATLDLRRLEPGDRADIDARMGLGSLIVLVPGDLPVQVSSSVGLGELQWPDNSSRRGTRAQDGTGLREELVVGDGRPTVQLDLSVRLGKIEVRRVAP